MAKRGGDNGKMVRVAEGIYRRNGQLLVPIYNPAKGNGGRDWHSGFSTIAEARAFKRDQDEKRRRRGRGGDETVAEFAARWTTDPAWQRPAESTNIHNAERVKAFVRDFGARPLGGVSRAEAQLWIAGGTAPPGLIQTAGRWHDVAQRGGAVEVPAHRGHLQVIRAMYNDAVAVEAVEANPFAALRIAQSRGRRDIEVISEAELELLVECAHTAHGSFGPWMASLIEVAAWTGVRPGELFALEPSAIDFDAKEIQVLAQINSRTGKRGPTKNKLRRTVVMLPMAERALRRIIEPGQQGPIFTTKRRKPYTARTHHYYWDPVRREFARRVDDGHWLRRRMEADPEAGNFDFYELRHLFGTRLAEMGASPYEIAQQMGHQDGGQLAMKNYIHIDASSARDRLRARFWGTGTEEATA